MARQKYLSLATALILGAVVGCKGTVEGSSDPDDMGKPGDPTKPGDPSKPGTNPKDPTTPVDPTMPVDPTKVDPNAAGPMPLRRLTNREYNNTVRDLLGDNSNPANAFPLDFNLTDFQFHRAGGISQQDIDTMKDASRTLGTAAEAKATTLAPCASGAAEDTCAKNFITSFGLRAYRRPLSADEVTRLTTLYTAGRKTMMMTYPQAIGLLVEGILQSPNFLYHWELGNEAAPTKEGDFVKLNPYEVASRLSYFLWSSMPDQALFDAAAAKKLGTPEELKAQAKRMLGDPKAADTVAIFVDEWMNLDWLLDPDRNKDPAVYPEFNNDLRMAMAAENKQFINRVMSTDAKLTTLLTATDSFLNKPLAAVYGKAGITGTTMTPTTLDPTQRGGLLTRADFLTVTGATNASHPVKRGRRVFERLLCNTMPPPPMGVQVPPPIPAMPGNGTTRERFEQHDKNACTGACHPVVDAFGFAFEHYDGIGKYRTTDNGGTVNSSGKVTLDGKTYEFKDAIDLSQQLSTNPLVASCFARQWLRYAFKRTETNGDLASLQGVTATLTSSNSISDLMVELAGSRSFRYRSPGTGENLQ